MGFRQIFIFLFLTFGLNAFAQEPVFISYELDLKNGLARNYFIEVKQKASRSYFTLTSNQTASIANKFKNHISSLEKLNSYTFFSSVLNPEITGEITIPELINKERSAGLNIFQDYELNNVRAELVELRGDDIILNGDLLFENKRFYSRSDTVWVEGLIGPARTEVIQTKKDFDTLISGLGFSETWSLDTLSHSFTKKVLMLSCFESQNAFYQNFRNKYIFNFITNSSDSSSKLKIFKENATYDVPMVGTNQSRVNYGYTSSNFIPAHLRYPFLEQLFSEVKNENIGVFAYDNELESLDLDSAVSFQHFFDNCASFDTILIENLGMRDTIIVETTIRLSDIAGIRFIEDWFFDEDQFIFIKKVKAIIPLIADIDNEGEVQGLKPMVPYVLVFDH